MFRPLRLINPALGKRFFSADVQPVKMVYEVFEGPQTDKTAPPLIIMHGLLGSKQNWRSVSRSLEQKLNRRIYAVDARNHGGSPHTPDHGSKLMTADMLHFMRAENIDKACVMGHSMGGRTMMYLAIKYPELVERAIIVDISPISIPRDFTNTTEVLQVLTEVKVPSDLSMPDGRKEALNQMKQHIDNPITNAFLLTNLKKRDTGEFYWAANVDALIRNVHSFHDFYQSIASDPPYQGPVLFIAGKKSPYLKPEEWPAIRNLFPQATLEWLNTGHLVHFEQPQAFMDLVIKFMKSEA